MKYLQYLSVSNAEINQCISEGWTRERIEAEIKRLLDTGCCSEKTVWDEFMENRQDFLADLTSMNRRTAKKASEFGDVTKRFLWKPYFPLAEYSAMVADSGTGKGILCCGIAAAVSAGKMLPGESEPRNPGTVLIISAEDDGADIKARLRKSGADLERCRILDRTDSEGMSIADRFEEFSSTVAYYKPALVFLDPWHCFLGSRVDMSRANALRPILQKLSLLAKENDTAIIAISHVNKRAQGENVNNAALGSTDFINAARSAVRVIFDESDPDQLRRILVHTKSNFAACGKSVVYRINDGGLEWTGFSDITKFTLESAARHRKSVGEQMTEALQKEEARYKLLAALIEEAQGMESRGKRFTYEDLKRLHGEDIFGSKHPKRALDVLVPELKERGILLETGLQIRRNSKLSNGFQMQAESVET